MRARRGLLPALLTALLAGTGTARAQDDRLATWRDPEVLARHLDAACRALEEVTGARFARRPTIRLSTQEDVERLLETRPEGEHGMLESTPDEARAFLAYYEPKAMEVHILPEQLARVAAALAAPELLDEDVLRIVLVHEATHALDFQRFPVRWVLACCAASDERLATEAVLEGHAQLVTEEVARRWGIEQGFERLTRLYTGGYAPEATAGSFDQEAAFTYLQGHAFMREVERARGVAGLAAVLEDPPCETRVIDRPSLWLDPVERAAEPDLQAVLEVFRPLGARPGWDMAKWRVLGPGPAAAAARLAPDGRPLAPYLDNHGLYGGAPDGGRYLNVFLASWASEAEAERFVAALRAVDQERDQDAGWDAATRTEGTGAARAHAGFGSWRTARGGGSPLVLHVARTGRHVIEVTAYGLPLEERTPQAEAVDLGVRLLEAPPSASAAVALRARVRSFLAARAAGEMGAARALLRDLLPSEADLRRVVRPEHAGVFSTYDGMRLALRTTHVTNTEILATLPEEGPATKVRVWGATTEDLAQGSGNAARFPAAMQAFARDVAAPGVVWLLLVLSEKEGEARHHLAFARLGDRFLWIKDPWTVGR